MSAYRSNLLVNCNIIVGKLLNHNKNHYSLIRQSYSCLAINCCTNKVHFNVPQRPPLRLPSLKDQLGCQSSSRFFHLNKGLCSGKVVPFHLSDIGEGISEVVIKEWFIKVGDEVNQFDSICEVQSDKASVTITSRYDGIIEKIHYGVDDIAKVGKPLVDIRLKEDARESLVQDDQVDQVADLEASKICDSQATSVIDWRGGKVLTTPAVRRIAAENNVRLSDVRGTGKYGRVLKEDVLRYIEESKAGGPIDVGIKTGQSTVSSTVGDSVALTDVPCELSRIPEPKKISTTIGTPGPSPTIRSSHPMSDRSVPFTAIQRAMFKSMTQSLRIPHFGLCDEVDMTNLLQVLPGLRQQAQEKGLKLTFMPLFIKALSLSLADFPSINSTIDEKNEKIILHSSHNVGFAMDSKNGLVVPNVKNVQNLSILEIAEEMKRLQEAGAKGQLRREDLSGGTITLSNIGSIGGQFGIPVIPPSEVVIGAIGQMKVLPRFDDKGDIVKGHIINVLWSADHRIIDGATMCRFSSVWKSFLQEPLRMIMNMK